MTIVSRQHISERQELQVSFSLPGRGPCDVSFTAEPDKDPERHGMGLIGVYDDLNKVKDYPVIRGTVSSRHARTYASIYGWIQITKKSGEPWVMDVYPMFEDVNSPFVCWGSEPTLVDAPTESNVEKIDWVARSFLCYTPDVAMHKRVVPILAFEWGFWIEDYKPFIKKLKQIEVSRWNDHLELFRNRYMNWTFDLVDDES